MKRFNVGKLAVLLLFCFIQTLVFAQDKAISGIITDADGSPLPGVSVLIKGTTTGTVTDIDGAYSLTAAPEATLVFSFIGLSAQEIVVGEQTTIDVTLREDIMELDEIVVTGYGVSKKSDLTGSMASLGEDEFNTVAGASPEQMMQGRVAGVEVTSNNGEPGAGAKITVRGASTFRAGAQPLYVIDGVPLDMQSTSPDGPSKGGIGSTATNPLNFINPSDIEKIDILKDASAAAIYGSRGANGVVIVTTKRVRKGKVRSIIPQISAFLSYQRNSMCSTLTSGELFGWILYPSLGRNIIMVLIPTGRTRFSDLHWGRAIPFPFQTVRRKQAIGPHLDTWIRKGS